MLSSGVRMRGSTADPIRRDTGPNRWLFLIGAGKIVKALLFVALGFGALHLAHRDIVSVATHWIVDLRFDPEGRFVNRVLDRLALVTPHRMRQISIGIFLYAAMDTLEGVGLVLGKTWAEYLTLLVTASLLPWEFFEIIRKPSWPKAVLTIVSIAIVFYLAAYLQRRMRERRQLSLV